LAGGTRLLKFHYHSFLLPSLSLSRSLSLLPSLSPLSLLPSLSLSLSPSLSFSHSLQFSFKANTSPLHSPLLLTRSEWRSLSLTSSLSLSPERPQWPCSVC